MDIMDAVVINPETGYCEVDVPRAAAILEYDGFKNLAEYSEFQKKVTKLVQKKSRIRVDSFRFFGIKLKETLGGDTGFATSGPDVEVK